MMDKVVIYCDGAARNNGKEDNVGGIGVVLKYKDHKKEIYKGFRNVTNNQMEIMAAIEGLKAMKKYNYPVEVYTDSAYLYNCIQNRWYEKWMNNGWLTANNKPVSNRELWIELVDLIQKFPFITFYKVKGHNGNELNERADYLANKAMDELI